VLKHVDKRCNDQYAKCIRTLGKQEFLVIAEVGWGAKEEQASFADPSHMSCTLSTFTKFINACYDCAFKKSKGCIEKD
jgi:hypothetical protein